MNCRIEGIISLLKRAAGEIDHLAFYSDNYNETTLLRVASSDIEMIISTMQDIQAGNHVDA